MAKSDIDRAGRLSRNYKRKICFDAYLGALEGQLQAKARNKERTVGIRTIVIDAYMKGGKEAALKAIQEANKRMGIEVYTSEMMESWIKEDLAKRNRDDDDAR